MGIELVLNELSFEPLAPDRIVARQRVLEFQRATSAAIKMRTNRYIRCPEHMMRRFLATGYGLGDWFNDAEVDLELRRIIKSWFSKSPYWQDDYPLEQKVRSRVFEYAGNTDAVGLGVASLLNGLGISFASHETWDQSRIDIRVLTEFYTEEEVSTLDEVISVRHFSHPNHLEEHKAWIEQRLTITPNDGKELWNRREEWFSKLSFCTNTESQLLELPSQMLASVCEHLVSLQRHCESWSSGNFDRSQFPPSRVSPETPVTLQQYGAVRTFICPDGIERTFSWHLKLTPSSWRIYFEPVMPDRYMIIGYIGPHLKTVNFSH